MTVTSPTTIQEGDISIINFEIILTLSENISQVARDIVYNVQLLDRSATGKCKGIFLFPGLPC